MDKVDLNIFFSKHNGEIIVFTKEEQISSQSSLGSSDILRDLIKNKYFLIFENLKLKFFDPKSVFYFKDKKVNLQRINRLIHDTKDRWEQTYTQIPFPIIWIKNEQFFSNSIHFNNESKIGTIYIDGETFCDYEKFKLTLGHELGHLVYEYKLEDYKFNHLNLVSITGSLMILLHFVIMIYGYKTSNKLEQLFLCLTFLASFILFSSYYYLNYKSFNERMRRYNMELFCDFFSFKFMKINYYKKPMLFKIGDNYLGFSHPRGITRLNHIKKNRKKENFVKINQKQSKFFQFCHIDHLIVYYLELIRKN